MTHEEFLQYSASVKIEGMTTIGRKIVALNTLPACLGMNTTKKCQLAQIDRQSWYNYMADVDFIAKMNEFCKTLWAKHAPLIQQTYLLAGGIDRIAAERILEQVALLDGKQGNNITINQTVVTHEREQKIKAGLERFGFSLVENTSDN